MKKAASFLLALALPALAAPALAGQAGRPGPQFGPGGFGGPMDFDALDERIEMRADRLADALDLTDDQRAAFTQLREEAMAAAQPKIERMRAGGEELRGLLDGGSQDAAAVGNLVLEMHRLRTELRASRDQVMSGLEALLTDTQKAALRAVQETRPRGPRFGGERGGGPGGPGGAPPAWLGGN